MHIHPEVVLLGGLGLLLGASGSPLPSRPSTPLPEDSTSTLSPNTTTGNPLPDLTHLSLAPREKDTNVEIVCHDHVFTRDHVKAAVKQAKRIHEAKDKHPDDYAEFPKPLDRRASDLFKKPDGLFQFPLVSDGVYDGKADVTGREFVIIDKNFKCKGAVRYYEDHAESKGHADACYARKRKDKDGKDKGKDKDKRKGGGGGAAGGGGGGHASGHASGGHGAGRTGLIVAGGAHGADEGDYDVC
ncbi:hypothetical protein BO82DRAFT_406027 [Aspergillus uvarum CBS 121591]|uniref:Uncharacterized protein n=1 Tax=Aspergillus uvarum CBS 121591 TaxID=1448315 RepID=A0A319BXZ6_9EURO|nr:hypothetical protein BO82DRAFT_406027 [Aspergillus uvarum CBS 121591]PYH77595.1 hypothetical protein BO82DRAFT_406027 [Aspergillus uvarum CBS 121591]